MFTALHALHTLLKVAVSRDILAIFMLKRFDLAPNKQANTVLLKICL